LLSALCLGCGSSTEAATLLLLLLLLVDVVDVVF